MYTAVLLAALTTGVEAPDCHGGWGGGWGGGYGCGWGDGYGWGGYGGYCGGYTGYGGYGYGGYLVRSRGYGYSVARRTTRNKATATVRAKRKSAPATVVVKVPADVKLMVGDQVMKSTGARRVFRTSPLKSGKDYQLTFKASVERAGRTVTWEQDVTVRAKKQARLTLTVPATSVAAR